MSLFGVGAGEALVVLVLAMIVVGPQRFPEIARQGGRWYRLARKYTDEVMTDVRAAVDDIEQEINTETEDLKSLGDVTGVGDELREIRDDVGDVTSEAATDAERTMTDTAAAAGSDGPGANGASSGPTLARDATSVRPSRRAKDS